MDDNNEYDAGYYSPFEMWAKTVALLSTLAALVFVAWAMVDTYPAEATPNQFTVAAQPYGGCKEAWQAPHSDGADWCRRHGWRVSARLVVGPHAVVRFSALPRCRQEDGSGQRSACSWNFTPGDGNSRGLAYWVDSHDRTHYVWPSDPAGHWVTSSHADALAEGDSPHATTRRWERCTVTGSTVTCPDGHKEQS